MEHTNAQLCDYQPVSGVSTSVVLQQQFEAHCTSDGLRDSTPFKRSPFVQFTQKKKKKVRPVDNFSCFVRIEKGDVLIDNVFKQLFSHSRRNSLSNRGQQRDVHKRQQTLQTPTVKQLLAFGSPLPPVAFSLLR